MSIKQPLTDRESPFGQFSLKNRVVASRTSYATAVVFHYKKQNFGIPTNTKTPAEMLATEDRFVSMSIEKVIIEEEISSMKVAKSIESVGTFELRILPSQNWKQKISPGDWVALYIHDSHGLKDHFEKKPQDSKNMVMLGNVDRIARSLEKDEETDKVISRYVVSGRGFGKVFEESDIWFDPYSVQEETLNRVALPTAGLELIGNPTTQVNALIDVFLGPGSELPSFKGRIPDLGNWRIPYQIAEIFNGSRPVFATNTLTVDQIDEALTNQYPKFYTILNKEIEPDLPGFSTRSMITVNSNGSLKDLIHRASNHLINEVIYEDVRSSDGSVRPTFIMKPRPLNTPFFESHFGSDERGEKERTKSLAAIKNKYTTLQDLAKTNFVEISQAEIKYENLGKDEHSKFNLFYLTTAQTVEQHLTYNAHFNKQFGIANPLLLKASVERNGLKRFEQRLDFCYTEGTDRNALKAPTPNIELYQGFMAQLYDMHFANHLYDAGTIECSGVLEAELGKALVVLPDLNNKEALPKAYFIEGYEHSWSFPHHWSTTFTLSHGQFLVKSGNKIFIDAADGDFGQPDKQTDIGYLAKTISEKA